MALYTLDCSPRIGFRSSPLPVGLPPKGRLALLVLPLVLAAGTAPADDPVAPYVPTVEEDVELMLDVASVEPGDYVIDLGSGDGRIVIAAARRGAFGHGVEIDPELVEIAERNAHEAGVDDRVVFRHGDIFEADINAANVVTLYLFPEVNIALRPKLLSELRPGTRVVSNSFDMGDWAPDVHDMSARSSGGILMWIVPAQVAGDWQLELDHANASAGADGDPGTSPDADAGADEHERERFALHIQQRYQRVELRFADAPEATSSVQWDVASAELRGDRLAFTAKAADRTYAFNGRIDAENTIDGFVQMRDASGGRVMRWRARR